MSARERAFYESVKERDLAGDCGNHLVTMLRLWQAANTPQLARRRESGARKSMFLAACVSIRQHASACLRVDAFGNKAFVARALRRRKGSEERRIRAASNCLVAYILLLLNVSSSVPFRPF